MKEHVGHSTRCVKRGRRRLGPGEGLALVSLAVADSQDQKPHPRASWLCPHLGAPSRVTPARASTEEGAECTDLAEDRG